MWWCCAEPDGKMFPCPKWRPSRNASDSASWRTRSQCQPFGARGTAVLVHRKQLSGRPRVRQLGGSESTGAPMCDRVNATYKKYIRALPRELFAVERLHLKPLPAWIPEVYRLHQRTVDVEGYVSVNAIRYSVPVSWIGRRVEVRETRDKIEIELDARHLVTHVRAVTPQAQRITLAEHRPPRGEGVPRRDPHPEEQALLQAAPEIAGYVTALQQKGRKVVALALRQLLRLLQKYPREPFLAAVREAAQYGLYDLDRLERMILRRVARDYFLLLDTDSDPHD